MEKDRAVVHAGDDYLLPICGEDPPNESLTVAFVEAQITCEKCIEKLKEERDGSRRVH